MGDRTPHQVYLYNCPPDQAQAATEALAQYTWDEEPAGDGIGDGAYACYEKSCGTSGEIAAALTAAAPGASFVLWEDPAYDWLGDVHAHTPALGAFTASCDANGQPVYTRAEVIAMMREAASGEDVFTFMDRKMGGPWLADWAAHGTPGNDAPVADAVPGLGDRDTAVVWAIHRGKLDEIAGRPVTDEEVSRVAIALEFSTVPDAVSDVVFAVCGSAEDDDEGE